MVREQQYQTTGRIKRNGSYHINDGEYTIINIYNLMNDFHQRIINIDSENKRRNSEECQYRCSSLFLMSIIEDIRMTVVNIFDICKCLVL